MELKRLGLKWLLCAGILFCFTAAAFCQPYIEQEKRYTKMTGGYEYLLYLPKDLDPKREEYPLVLYLHGASVRGKNLDRLRKQVPVNLMVKDGKLPFIVAAPLEIKRDTWDSGKLNGFLTELLKRNPVDKERVYVTGISLGGYGTWAMGMAHPDRIAAIAPLCGWAKANDARQLKDLPIWGFHGGKDKVVPLNYTLKLVNAIKNFGNPQFQYTVYPNDGHDIWYKTYNNPKLYEWFLSHKNHG